MKQDQTSCRQEKAKCVAGMARGEVLAHDYPLCVDLETYRLSHWLLPVSRQICLSKITSYSSSEHLSRESEQQLNLLKVVLCSWSWTAERAPS